MKKYIYSIILAVFVFSPIFVSAHGEQPDTEEHLADDMMGMMDDFEEPSSDIEPCEFGSVIKCGDHGEGSSQTLDAVVDDLLTGFKVSNVSQLNCDDIIEHDFEHVGDALMSYMHSDEEEHETIDQMMGGEGSDQLESMHVFMGKRYLGCNEDAFGPMMMDFGGMGGGSMLSGMMGVAAMPFQMMGGSFNPLTFNSMMSGGGLFVGGLFQLVIIILAILGVVWIVQKIINNKK